MLYEITDTDVKFAKAMVPRLVEEMNQWSTSSIWAKIFDGILYRKIGRPHNRTTSVQDFWYYIIEEAAREVTDSEMGDTPTQRDFGPAGHNN